MGTELLDLGVVCLICLHEEPGYCSIYGQDLETPNMQILEKIRSCSTLQLEQPLLQRLPDKICHGCQNELNITFRFLQKCQEAQKVFQNLNHMPLRCASANLIETSEAAELELKQQLKLPANLKIKRVDNLEAAGSSLLLQAQSPLRTPVNNNLEYYNEDALTLMPEASEIRTLVLQEAPGSSVTLSLDSIDMQNSNNPQTEEHADETVEVNDRMLIMPAWEYKSPSQLQELLQAEEENKEQQEQLYEIGADLLEKTKNNLLESTSVLPKTRRRYKRVSPVVKPSVPPELAPEIASDYDDNDDYEFAMKPVATKRTNSSRTSRNTATKKADSSSMETSKSTRTRNRRGVEPPPKICDICGNTYKYQHALVAHMRRHNNERPYPCEVCSKAFISNVELRRHIRVHTGQKPYGCRYCDRRFSDFGSSKKHERIHTGERPYVCDVCKKGFAYAHVLSVHKRTHTGMKQFQCTQCDKGFTKKAYLLTHMASQHVTGALCKNDVSDDAATTTTNTSRRLPTRNHMQIEDVDCFKVEQDDEDDDDDDGIIDDPNDDDTVSISLSMSAAAPHTAHNDIVEEAKVLEECIVANDFMFEPEDEYDDDDDDNVDNGADNSHFQHVTDKGPYELVGDLLEDDDLEEETKYMIG